MRADRLEMVATRIEHMGPDQFDMGEWWCGTAGCIAGWAEVILHELGHENLKEDTADNWLGLDGLTANRLFIPSSADYGHGIYLATGAEAARVVRHLILTGRVDCSLVRIDDEEAERRQKIRDEAD